MKEEEGEKTIEIPIEEFSRIEKIDGKIRIVISGRKKEKEKKQREEKVKVSEEKEIKTEREKLKEEIHMRDIKKEFRKYLEEIEKEKKVKEEKKKPSFFSRFKGLRLFGRKKKKFADIVKEGALKNLEIAFRLPEKEKRIVAMAAVLNDFMEIYLGEERELTYKELAERLEKTKMEDEILKNKLIDFFNRITVEEYKGKITEDPETVYRLVKETILKLSSDLKKRFK